MSRFGTYLGSGVTVRYVFGTTSKKKKEIYCKPIVGYVLEIYYARFLFIYFEQSSAN